MLNPYFIVSKDIIPSALPFKKSPLFSEKYIYFGIVKACFSW
ncbi:hypothetical protein BARBAKC583_0267 [Bartonella bacilliformis KC583]|uniref:Uncharacterized protein n=1 Tax=Bartonella bacilliformis (strain ATCC 35685 / KC583 / Herrer 020/F12,63) TaxID=360095 RepID=A1URJ0_BARBK|nr:hypothetical protein BARBAKC583_0267 [Bartonella bacilliformis KC583]